MRVLLVNTSERAGGAAVATFRLMEALNNNGVKAKMLVGTKETDHLSVVQLPKQWYYKWCFLWERLMLFTHLRFCRQNLFAIDIANIGTDITKLPEFRQADVIHLSWINQGMLSLGTIRKILKSGKPVVWTMHDLWPVSSICHLSMTCKKFKQHCSRCPYLPNGGASKDLSYRVWERKAKVYGQGDITFVACSKWLSQEAKESGLVTPKQVMSIPNTLNTQVFCRQDKDVCRRKWELPTAKRLLLFVAQRVTNANKGMSYLVDACRELTSLYPEMRQNTAIVVLGGDAEALKQSFDMPVYPLGYISEEKEIVEVYNAVDAFVLPSLSENLPNTIMESMACGIPCIGFEVGGIPEMIDHRKNGYVARYRDAADLARGIRWVLHEADYESLSREAVHKVLTHYSQQAVALRYIDVYNQLLANKTYRL